MRPQLHARLTLDSLDLGMVQDHARKKQDTV